MTTVFTLPILEFPRYDPVTLVRSGMGSLKMNYVFSIIGKVAPSPFLHILLFRIDWYAAVGATLIMAVPLIIAAFKVRRLQSGWKRMKEIRLTVFPLHFAGRNGIPEPDEPGGERGQPILWRLYWKGPSPRRHLRPEDIWWTGLLVTCMGFGM
jgi:hypothetical protein